MPWLIGLDWGTTRLRAMLFDGDGAVHETRERPWGIRHLPDGGFDAALSSICEGWPQVPVLAAGMVGSRQGWREVGYADTPADVDVLMAGIVAVRSADGRQLGIVPGVRDSASMDVMRGEETQVIGALACRPELSGRAQLLLPGTHSKWVEVRDGRIVRVSTMMTGELYAVLREHSILGAGIPEADATTTNHEAFDAGVRIARDSGAAGVLTRLFSARALMLAGRLALDAVPDYLSGMLIGEEWRAGLASGWLLPDTSPLLVGDERLCARYARAATLFRLPEADCISDASAHGLWRIGRAAALVGPSAIAQAQGAH
ncbi:2-dehydro-3-deoxygalactonokinase [Rhodanobacter sp. L36]|uniref:2-dehydro-3-deoxygalactonokinase n=1 Tax=Rhodanobacter sp. L36 TaxID=1747221 RepID=UPI00131B9D91|nr:2-dehydro-3-deoxygalactonokinase [Rhodanobacter sp. L36]